MVEDDPKPRNGCLKDQCTLAKFGLDHDRPEDFMTPQWNWSQLWFIIYRSFFAIYWMIWLILSTVINWGWFTNENNRIRSLVYLTTWNLILMTTTAFLQAFVAIYYFSKKMVDKEHPKNFVRMNIALRTLWVLYNISSTGAIIITVFYWTVDFHSPLSPHVINIHLHALNAVYILVDVWIIAIPIRIQHIYQPLIYGLIYGLFSVFYHLAGGWNALDQPYIYKALDWSQPKVAIVYYVLAEFVAIPGGFLLIFAFQKLRLKLYQRYSKRATGNDDTADLHTPETDANDVTTTQAPIRKRADLQSDYGSTLEGTF